jgi:cytidyltransferase-like protein
MTNGYLASTFDLLNVSDLDVIAQARRSCDSLLVGVFSDEHVERIFGRRPVVPLTERLELVRHVRGVDHAVEHDEIDADMIRKNHLIFRVGAHNAHQRGSDEAWLEPTRQTRSHLLRAALAPADALADDAHRGIA